MPDTGPVIGFAPVVEADYLLLDRWLRSPHVREWWGDPEEELGQIRGMVEGRDTTLPFMILVDDAPVGYIQVWFIGHHQNAEWLASHPWLADLPTGAVGVDLTLGEPALLSKGIGSAALSAFVDRLRSEGHGTIVIDPDPSNGRALRAYEKAGFRPVPHLVGQTGDALIMQHHATAR